MITMHDDDDDDDARCFLMMLLLSLSMVCNLVCILVSNVESVPIVGAQPSPLDSNTMHWILQNTLVPSILRMMHKIIVMIAMIR